ncbi:MAG: hypothetical protein ACLPY5_15215 [Candidatus Bathyarchaeia archaeon]
MAFLNRIGARLLVSLVILVIALALAPSRAYAAPFITIWVNPPTPLANSRVQFVGVISPSLGSSQAVTVTLYQGSGCTHAIGSIGPVPADNTGSSYNTGGIDIGSGFFARVGPGTYSASAHISNPQYTSLCQEFDVFLSLPETMALSVNPSSPSANSTVEFQGTITPGMGSAQKIDVILFSGNICGLSMGVGGFPATTDSTGSSYNVSVVIGSGAALSVGAGNWSAIALVENGGRSEVWSSCVNFTISAPVPEFPIGLPVLLIVVLIACGQITRRSTRKARV